MCKDYQLSGITFNGNNIHIIKDKQGLPLSDIRTPQDNEQVANVISAYVQQFTQNPQSALHVSIAGGRKTMGFYLGYALSLYGRPQDRLSHVLVSSPFESNAGFFYPTPKTHIIHTHPPDSRPLDTSKAVVTLADIPFVRLRDDLPQRFISHPRSFSDLVDAAQHHRPKLLINKNKRTLQAGDEVLHLAPAEFAFYSFMVDRRLQDLPPIRWTDSDFGADYLAHYQTITKNKGDYERVAYALKDGMTKEYFDTKKSKTNHRLKELLGERNATYYLIKAMGKKPNTRFGIDLAVDAIEFEVIK